MDILELLGKTAASAIGEVHDSTEATAVAPTRTRRNGDAAATMDKSPRSCWTTVNRSRKESADGLPSSNVAEIYDNGQ